LNVRNKILHSIHTTGLAH